MSSTDTDLKTYDYRNIPALAAYIDRIGAEQLNFKRFMIKDHKGNYYIERCLIRIMEDGTIKASKKEYAPTKEEAEQIKGALMSHNWPKPIGAKSLDAFIKASGARKEDLFEFIDRRNNKITMVQERRRFKDGTKAYLPWTMYSDGVVRMMEPEGDLPFWKPSKKQSDQIMIHEGAKTGAFVDWMCNSKDEEAAKLRAVHPWHEELKEYEHWGMIGGALAPHRADYAELANEKPTNVVYICDNDFAGRSAIEAISRLWERPLKGLFFDQRWPMAFDLADEFTGKTVPALFSKKGHYTGPSLESMLFPATHATELVYPVEGAGRPSAVIARAFQEEWWHCIQPEVYIHKDFPNQIWTATEFNHLVSPFSDTDDTSRLLKRDKGGMGVLLSYDPSKKPGLYATHEKEMHINTHVPSPIKPLKPSSKKGYIDPFLEYLTYMIPNEEDRKQLMRWCATLIARPDIKMHYGVLLISETQGVGKTTLGEKILAPLVGVRNVSMPNETDIVESQYNYWCAHKRLAIMNEIYAGHSARAYNKLKGIITDKTITVSKKYQANYEVENWVHAFACSNSMKAIKIDNDDRRWLVPGVVEEKWPAKKWAELNDWLTEQHGLEYIAWWAKEFDDYVMPGEAAPISSRKKEVIQEGMSDGQRLVMEALRVIKEMDTDGKGIILTDQSLVEFIKQRIYDGRKPEFLEKPLAVRKVAKMFPDEWFVGELPARLKEWGTHMTSCRIIATRKDLTLMTAPELNEKGYKPFDPLSLPQNM